MASSSQSQTVAADFDKTTISIPIDNRRVIGATVANLTEGSRAAQSYVVIGITVAKTDNQNKIAVLAAGYVGYNNPLSFFLPFTGDRNQSIYADIYAETEDTFRLTILHERKG